MSDVRLNAEASRLSLGGACTTLREYESPAKRPLRVLDSTPSQAPVNTSIHIASGMLDILRKNWGHFRSKPAATALRVTKNTTNTLFILDNVATHLNLKVQSSSVSPLTLNHKLIQMIGWVGMPFS